MKRVRRRHCQDADASLKLSPSYAKAYFAKGRALYFLGDYEAAFANYEAGLGIEANPRIQAWIDSERTKAEYIAASHPVR